MLLSANRIAKRGTAGIFPALSVAIAIAGVALSPAANAEPSAARIVPTEAVDSPQPPTPAAPVPPTRGKTSAKPSAAKAKVVPPRHTAQPDDNVADDLNRRESERLRTGQAAPAATAPAPATPAASTPMAATPTVATPAAPAPTAVASVTPPASIPATASDVPTAVVTPMPPQRAPIDQASLPSARAAMPDPAARMPAAAPAREPAVGQVPPAREPMPRMAQAVPTAPETPATGVVPRVAQAVPPAPVPRTAVPAQAPSGEAGSVDFGRNAVVATEPPTLALETNKAQFIRLRSPAATVFIANPEIADVQVRSPTLIYVYGKRPGTTVLYAVDDRERILVNTVVSVTHEFSRLMQILDRLHPGHGIIFTSNNDNIVLSGTASSALVVEDARRLAVQHVSSPAKVINNVIVGGPNQINLRVRVVEVARGSLKNLGISWAAVGQLGNFAIGAITGALTGFPAGIIAGAGLAGTNNVGAASYRGPNFAIDSVIQALADENLLTVLAEPNLTAMSGETASFLAGGEVPIPVSQGNGSTTVEYKQFGVALAFTPTLIDNRINLRVRPEVSQVDSSLSVPCGINLSCPGFQTRRADTTIELGSGQSFAIAGLLLRNTNQTQSRVPGLGEVPVLGALFRSDKFQRNETELVIIVTPYIVQPSSTRLATPADGYYPPSDSGRYLYGMTNSQMQGRGAGGPYGSAGFKLIGPVGFMVE